MDLGNANWNLLRWSLLAVGIAALGNGAIMLQQQKEAFFAYASIAAGVLILGLIAARWKKGPIAFH
ncbi:hypothetical protein [Solilutibacter tolerans]|uniref:hypothetical protein n=1 Tax=Solilutibacter tolerans TaxID=1604334 RepID=UPI0009712EFC|nr:hypothetical protein [Lysobacter tolerans]